MVTTMTTMTTTTTTTPRSMKEIGRKTRCRRTALFVILLVLLSIVIMVPFLSVTLREDIHNLERVSKVSSDEWNTPTGWRKTLTKDDIPSVTMSHNALTDGYNHANSTTLHVHKSPSVVAPTTSIGSHQSFLSPLPVSQHVERPYFIIHAGPDKTGTTSIQNFLQKQLHLLELDGYDASFSKGSSNKPHRQSSGFLLNCFIFPKYVRRPCHINFKMQNKTNRNVEYFLPKINSSTATTTTTTTTTATTTTPNNILWSNEGFRWAQLGVNPDWTWFLQQLQPYFGEIRILVVYRRYFDWLISRYNEDHRSSEYSGIAFLKWPDDIEGNGGGGGGGGMDTPTFEDYWNHEKTGTCPDTNARGQKDCTNFFANRIRTTQQRQRRRQHEESNSAAGNQNGTTSDIVAVHPLLEMTRPLLQFQNQYPMNLTTIRVLNFHGQLDILEAFFCQGIPRTGKSWSVRQPHEQESPPNTSTPTSQACLEARHQVQAKRQAQFLAEQQQNESENTTTTSAPQQEQGQVVQSAADAGNGGSRVGAGKRRERNERHTSRKSDGMQIQYDRIALEAHRMGILDPTLPRSTARYQVGNYLAETYNKNDDDNVDDDDDDDDDGLSWVCPSSFVLQELESLSFQFEQELLQLEMGRHLTFSESHADAFAQALKQRKFCSVNTTQILENKDFRLFLSNLTTFNGENEKGGKGNKKKKKDRGDGGKKGLVEKRNESEQ